VLVDLQPLRIVFSPDGTSAFVTSFLELSLRRINTSTLALDSPVEIGDSPHGTVIAVAGRRLYVALFGRSGNGRFVQIVSPGNGGTFDFIRVGTGPAGIAVTPVP
jgi:DNA-binding beta-propeller fold protein YncE